MHKIRSTYIPFNHMRNLHEIVIYYVPQEGTREAMKVHEDWVSTGSRMGAVLDCDLTLDNVLPDSRPFLGHDGSDLIGLSICYPLLCLRLRVVFDPAVIIIHYIPLLLQLDQSIF